MTELFRLSNDKSVAIDTQVSFYSMNTCPHGVKVQLHTVGGVAIYSVVNNSKDARFYQGWRPVPSGVKNVE